MSWERCKARATDPLTTRRPREDGWTCGHDEGHTGSHELYSADGERTLYAGTWVMPEVGVTPTTIPTPQLTEQAREQRTRLVMDLGSQVLTTFGPDSAAVFLDHAARYVETGEDDDWRRQWAWAS